MYSVGFDLLWYKLWYKEEDVTRFVFDYGMFSVSAKYLSKQNGSNNYYYTRRIPAGVVRALKAQSGFKGPAKIKEVISTRTADRQKALKEASRINRYLEAQWAAIEAGEPTIEVIKSSEELFKTYHNQPFDLGDFIEERLSGEAKKELFDIALAGGNREREDDILQQNLDDVTWQALQRSRGIDLWSLSAIQQEYLELKGWANNRKQRNSVDGAFATFISSLGDISTSDVSRLDVHRLVKNLIEEQGLKTATVKRKLSVIRAAINYVGQLREIELHNPFKNVEIPNLLEDAKDREDFTKEQQEMIRTRLTTTNEPNEIDNLIGLLMDTGMRVAEVVGLQADDIVLDAEVPHIRLHRNSMRRLKTKSSKRLVPLVGAALSSALRVKGNSDTFVFPRYVDEDSGTLKNDTASASVNKRLKVWLGEGAPTCHSFRHTMATRLRNVGCPKDVRDELGGWAKSISDNYGSPTDLRLKREYLQNSIDTVRR